MTESLTDMLLGPDNPFSDEYVRQEVAWYGKPAVEMEGIKIQVETPFHRLDDYLNKNFRIDSTLQVPVFYIDGSLWMSLTPMEIQSQFLTILQAAGVVGLAGLGLGYAALKVAEKDRVEKVVVFEKDPRVVAFFKNAFADRKGFSKFEFIVGDARQEVPEYTQTKGCFDHLYVDIYQTLLSDQVIDDAYLFRNSVEDREGYTFWGQERVFIDAALSEELLDPLDLPLTLRAYIERWASTPISTDSRLASTVLSDLYGGVCQRGFIGSVFQTLEVEY